MQGRQYACGGSGYMENLCTFYSVFCESKMTLKNIVYFLKIQIETFTSVIVSWATVSPLLRDRAPLVCQEGQLIFLD